jgi:hypothetical protein
LRLVEVDQSTLSTSATALQPGEFGSEQFFVEDTCGEGEGMFR